MEVVADTRPFASVARSAPCTPVIARLVVVALVEVEFVVMMLVAFRFVMVATAAVRESAILVVNRARVEKKEVEVALVMVAFDDERF